jgi:hypothetical protein
MTLMEIAALVTALLAVAGAIGGVVRWAAARFDRQSAKLDRLESDHAALFRTHSLVLVRLERFRLAFQMVASELARKSPGNIALVHARALLDDAFVVEADLPDELRDLLHAIDARAAAGAQAA